MTLKRTLLASALALLFSQAALAADVAGSAGSVTVTDTDLTTLFRDNSVDIATVPEPAVENALKNEIGRRLLENEAKKAGTDKAPEVQRAMARAASQELIRRYIASQAQLPAGFPSDQDLRAAYDQNRAKLVQPRRVKLAQIVVQGSDDATQKRAQALAADLKKNPDGFADAAARNGGDRASALSGTDWVPVAQLQPFIVKAVDTLPKGGVTSAIQTPDKQAYLVLRVIDRAEESTPTLEQVRGELTQAMRQQRTQQEEAEVVRRITSANQPTINTGVLSRISQPGTTPAPAAAPAAAPSPAPAPK